MPRRVSAKRYAQAMFELAREQDQLDAWAADLQMVSQALQDPDFRTFLSHADVSVEEKIKATGAVLGEVHPLVLNLVNVLVASGLVDLAPELQAAYNGLLDVHHGRQRVEVTSAVPLDDAELTQITSFVSDLISKEVVVTTRVKKIHRTTSSGSSPVTSKSILSMMKPNATPRTTFRTIRTITTTGARVIRVSTGAKARETPNMAAAPLPPRNFKNTGQLCPATTKAVVIKTAQWGAPSQVGTNTAGAPSQVGTNTAGAPSQVGTNTASTPFPASIIKTGTAAQVPS